MTETHARIVLVGECRVLREGLARILTQKGYLIVGQLRGLVGIVEACVREKPDLLVIDTPTRGNLGRTLKAVRHERPRQRVLLLAQLADFGSRLELEALRAGASWFPESSLSQLLDGVAEALRGNTVYSPQAAYRLFSGLANLERQHRRRRGSEVHKLTHREQEILEYIARGMTNKTIAENLCLSPHTVKNHVHNLLSKLNVGQRWEAAALARQRGWVSGVGASRSGH